MRNPFAAGVVQFYPANASLLGVSDPYFRGYDQNNADYWLFKEWEREFDQYVANGNLPHLQLVRAAPRPLRRLRPPRSTG